jgi:hypothetical protein
VFLSARNSGDPPPPVLFDRIRRRYSTVGGVWDVWGGGAREASLPRTAQMNPLGKGGGLPRLLSISVL